MSDELPETDAGVMLITSSLESLREFFDSVHIVCTRYDNDGEGFTDVISRGAGNWNARYGSLKETVIKLEESMRKKQE